MNKNKIVYYNVENGAATRVTCTYNLNSNNITITSGFYKITKMKNKLLYSNTDTKTGINTYVRCGYNLHTNNITITSGFCKHGNCTSQTNKSCSNYLGINIAEHVLSKVFKDVEIMPRNNPGFDFICNKGYKIDVKSSTLGGNGNTWSFAIKRNKTPDYFLCLSFDNIYNLTPQHVWLIPCEIVNNTVKISISKSTIKKWSKYELTNKLDDIIMCCNVMKETKVQNFKTF